MDNFFGEDQMTKYRVDPQHNPLNNVTLQTNGLGYLKTAQLENGSFVGSISEKNDDYT